MNAATNLTILTNLTLQDMLIWNDIFDKKLSILSLTKLAKLMAKK